MKYLFAYVCCLFLLAVGLTTLSAERLEPVLGTDIIPRLIAPETRMAAFREVQIARHGENPRHDWRELPMAAFELYHQDILVTECPQLNDAPPLYMVSYLWDTSAFRRQYSNHSGRSAGFAPVEDAYKPADLVETLRRFSTWATSPENPDLSVPPHGKLEDRVIVFLTSKGKVVWPFQGDNLTEGDVFKDLNGDGRYERVYSSNFGLYDKRKGEPDIWVQALRVEAVGQESERLFYLLLNWQSRKSAVSPPWGWTVRDLEGDGLDEIVIGPISDENAEPEAVVVYRWNPTQKQYVGPRGSDDDHYLLLDPEAGLWDELHRVKAAGGMQYEAVARADAPKVEAEAPEAAYDWRQREPYRHHSLAGASNETLLDFMCGWSPSAKSSSGGEEAVVANSNHRFKFQADWAELDPKAAAFVFVDTNQSHVHRNKYTLYYPTNLLQAERADWVVLSSLAGPGVQAIRTSGEGAGRYISAQFSRPLPEKYPAGDFNWKWKSASMDPDEVNWLQDTLWWLAQIRSEAKVRERGWHSISSSFTTNCFPTYMETSPPAVRLLRDGEPAVIDIKAERAGGYSSSWREEYGAEQYLGFADRLFQENKGKLLAERPNGLTVSELFEASPTFIVDLEAGRIPPQLAKAMIRSAGDSGDAGLLPILKEIHTRIPEKTEMESEWQRLQDAIEALPDKIDVETYKVKIDLEAQMEAIEQAMRDNLWTWLREPLHFAIRQLEVADDIEALAAWAEQPGESGALWALARIKEIDLDAWRQVLNRVFLRKPQWRKKIVRYLAYKERTLADALVAELPRAEQLEVLPSLLGSKKPGEMDDETVAGLLATIREDALDAKTRVSALRKLVPKNNPHAIKSVEVDQVLLEVLQKEMEPLREPWLERYLVYDAALVLLLRDKLPLPVDLYIKGAEARWNQFSFGSYLELVLHLAVVKESVEARDWLVQWGHDFIERDAGAWSRFAEIVYAADLHQFGPFLQRIATFDPQSVEGGSGMGKGRQPELKHGDRYHLARRIVAVWNEPDALTRAKCELLLGLNASHRFGTDELYSPTARIKETLSRRFERMSAVEREAFVRFVNWCHEAINPAQIDYQNRQYFEWIADTFSGG